MNKKKIIFESIFFIVMTALTLYYLISSNVLASIKDIKNVSWYGILCICSVVVLYVLMDSFIIFRNLHGICNTKHYMDGIATYAFGNLGSAVTPWKSGHFPLIAYFIKKRGHTTEETLSVMASNQMIYSLTLPALYFIFMVYAIVHKSTVSIGSVDVKLYLISLIGILTNIGYFTMLMLMLHNQKVQERIFSIELWVLTHLHRVEDPNAWLSEKRFKARVYKEAYLRMKKNILYNIPSILAYIIFMLALNGLPYVIYLVLSKDTFSFEMYLSCFMLCQAMAYVTNILPVPGGMGTVEFSFLTIYSGLMGEYLNLALILYRLASFILLTLVNFIIFSGYQIYWMILDNKSSE